MKYTFEQISDKLSEYTYMGVMLLVTLCIAFVYYIAYAKMKRRYLATLTFVAASVVLWLVLVNVGMGSNILLTMVTLEITCVAIFLSIIEILRWAHKQ